MPPIEQMIEELLTTHQITIPTGLDSETFIWVGYRFHLFLDDNQIEQPTEALFFEQFGYTPPAGVDATEIYQAVAKVDDLFKRAF